MTIVIALIIGIPILLTAILFAINLASERRRLYTVPRYVRDNKSTGHWEYD